MGVLCFNVGWMGGTLVCNNSLSIFEHSWLECGNLLNWWYLELHVKADHTSFGNPLWMKPSWDAVVSYIGIWSSHVWISLSPLACDSVIETKLILKVWEVKRLVGSWFSNLMRSNANNDLIYWWIEFRLPITTFLNGDWDLLLMEVI